MAFREHIAEVLLLASTTTGDNGNGQRVGQLAQRLVGIAVLCSIVVHRGKQYLSGTTLLSFTGPLEKTSLCALATTLQVTVPAVFIQTGIDGDNTYLATKTVGNLVDEFGATDGSRINAHLIGSCIEQSFYIL